MIVIHLSSNFLQARQPSADLFMNVTVQSASSKPTATQCILHFPAPPRAYASPVELGKKHFISATAELSRNSAL